MKTPFKLAAASPARSTSSLLPFVLYLILFYGVWTAWVLWVYPRMLTLGSATLAYALLNFFCRFLIWILPVYLYLRLVDRVDPLAYLRLTRHWQRGLVVALILSAINFLGSWLRFGPPHINAQDLTWNSILGTSILVGFFEEIPFRGFILQKLQEKYPFWLANLLSSLLFLAIHLPGWLSLHLFSLAIAVPVFVLGVILAAVLHYSKSLWGCIITHSLNDFFSFLLFRTSP